MIDREGSAKKKQRQRERVSGRWVEEVKKVKKRRQQKRKTRRQKKNRFLMWLCFSYADFI